MVAISKVLFEYTAATTENVFEKFKTASISSRKVDLRQFDFTNFNWKLLVKTLEKDADTRNRVIKSPKGCFRSEKKIDFSDVLLYSDRLGQGFSASASNESLLFREPPTEVSTYLNAIAYPALTFAHLSSYLSSDLPPKNWT